ncbi:MAG: putative D-ribose transporter permease protein [Modestobacter sp.]|jgi:ribose transport system permease protein|nr:putative D-ribose transporter permease protein [Modestobacter sp.]
MTDTRSFDPPRVAGPEGDDGGGEPRTSPWVTGLRLLGKGKLFLVLLLTMFIGTQVSPYFLTQGNLRNIVIAGSVVSVLAVAQFMVIVTGGIDLSVGSVAALATVVTAVLLRGGQNTWLAVLITLAVCAGVGLINGCLVVYARITPFIATLGTMSMVRGLAFLVQVGTLIVISDKAFLTVFGGATAGVPHSVVIFMIVMLVAGFVMRYTAFGRRLYAIGGNREAARLSGLPVHRDLLTAYAVAGLLAGLAGLMLAGQLSQGSSLVGQGYELDSIAAAVVGGAALMGGTGGPVTAVIGGLLIGTISNIMNLAGVQSEPQLVIKGGLILIAVFLTGGGGAQRVRAWFLRRRRGAGSSKEAVGG